MKKETLAVLMTALLLTSCGRTTGKDVDIEALAETIAQTVAFDDDLALIDDSMISMMYDIDGYADAVLYKGSGATAEEIALFRMESASDAQTAYQEAQAHIQSQIAAYANYLPDEVDRLEDAVIRQDGCYVSVVVSADADAAEKLLKEQF
jgi:predicted small secreted protein